MTQTDKNTGCVGDIARTRGLGNGTEPACRRNGRPRAALTVTLTLAALAGVFGWQPVTAADPGVEADAIRIGGVMDLEGRARGLGQGMKNGIEAAIDGVQIDGRSIEYVTTNDSYDPPKTIDATESILSDGVFLMAGNVGTPTAKVSLPILAREEVPAVGFFTGAGLLRPGEGDVVNFRASYVQETERVIASAIEAGLAPSEICAYVQNDAYGMAGVTGIRDALSGRDGTREIIQRLDEILEAEGDPPERNGIGPVGVYVRSSVEARSGYLSLKEWESEQDTRCRLVVTVGAYAPIAEFAGYGRYKDEDWVISAVSFTGADDLQNALDDLRIRDGVVMTQVVPHESSTLPIVEEAREALGDRFGYVSMEGYIVGKLIVEGLRRIEGSVTRSAFLDAVLDTTMDLGGLELDFTDDNQGSDLVIQTRLEDGEFQLLDDADWDAVLR